MARRRFHQIGVSPVFGRYVAERRRPGGDVLYVDAPVQQPVQEADDLRALDAVVRLERAVRISRQPAVGDAYLDVFLGPMAADVAQFDRLRAVLAVNTADHRGEFGPRDELIGPERAVIIDIDDFFRGQIVGGLAIPFPILKFQLVCDRIVFPMVSIKRGK